MVKIGRRIKTRKNVARKLVGPFVGWTHVIVMDNFFTFVDLFDTLAQMDIYVTNTIWSNHIGI